MAGLFSVWHLGIPDVQERAWTLTIGGRVARPLTLDLNDLRCLPQTSVTSVHECAGRPLKPEVPQRRVGSVRWGGDRLRDLLEAAGIEPGAAYVISVGCDHGTFNSVHHDRYEKDLPISKALDGNSLVALNVNGEPLPAEHGGPARLVVPGLSRRLDVGLVSSTAVSYMVFAIKTRRSRTVLELVGQAPRPRQP